MFEDTYCLDILTVSKIPLELLDTDKSSLKCKTMSDNDNLFVFKENANKNVPTHYKITTVLDILSQWVKQRRETPYNCLFSTFDGCSKFDDIKKPIN